VCSRTASASPYGALPGWALRGCIIKSGDDCRQELLALQLMRELADIWAGEWLLVRLRVGASRPSGPPGGGWVGACTR
jgi:phosphatidylinositol 4-kinase